MSSWFVVEVLLVEASLTLPIRGFGRVLCIGLERPEIVLEPGDEGDVLQRAALAGSFEDIAQHRAVDLDVLRFSVLSRPCAEEEVRRVEAADCSLDCRLVQDIDRYMAHPS